MKLRLFPCFALILIAACGPLAMSGKGPPETKDRLSPHRMEQLVKRPMGLVNEGHLDEGEAEFQRIVEEARLKHGPASVEVADLFSAFGVQLFMEGSEESRQASREYLRQAIPTFRAAFGPSHPEVAVALNDLASVEKVLSPEDPPPVIEDLLRETLSIRAGKLGPTHHETRATMTYLANVYSLPAWLERDPGRFRQADDLYRGALVGAPTGPKGDVTNAASIRVRLGTLYARAGHQREAIQLVQQSLAMSQRWPAKERCRLVESRLDGFVEAMSASGAKSAAEAILPEPGESACSRVLEHGWLEQFLRDLGIR